MPFRPNIVVRRPGEPAPDLAVEVILSEPDWENAADRLRGYMAQMRCPVGIVVTPTSLRILEERYTVMGPESIVVLGPYPVDLPRPPEGRLADAKFEGIVQDWLDGLVQGVALDRLSVGTSAALHTHVLPALYGGSLRASGPREHHA
jgi:hypothetical protein